MDPRHARQGQVEVLGRSASAVRLVPMIGVLKVNKREYPGALEIVPSGENLVVINELPLEDYLAGAVKAEAGDKMPMEMLKAQAIVARTYAAYHRQLNESKPYHIVASTAHQQYLGHVPDDSPVWTAVRETEGRVMLLGGALFPAFYHTDSGGHTEDPRVVFGTAQYAARSSRCAWISPRSRPIRVEARRSLSELGALLLKHGISVGRVVALEVLERSSSLRVTYIAVRGLKGTATLRGNDLRRLVGYDTLKSTLFAVAVDGPIARLPGADTATGWGSISGAPRPWPTSATTRPRSSSTTTRAPPSPRSDGRKGPTCFVACRAARVTSGPAQDTDCPLAPATLWVGLKNSDDQGTKFDVQVRVYRSLSDPVDQPIAAGLTRCVAGVTRNPNLAKEVPVEFSQHVAGSYAIRVFTRIGTNADDTKCLGPGGSHHNALGLRLYFDASSRPTRIGNPLLYLHDTTPRDLLSTVAPGAGPTKQEDSTHINVATGNPWRQVGTGWTQ